MNQNDTNEKGNQVLNCSLFIDLFYEQLSDYVIVGKHLCRKIIVVKNDDIQYMNYSIAIDNPKYDRNSLLFSLGFILSEGADTEPFEPILRKLSLAFLALEVRSNFKTSLMSHQCNLMDITTNYLY